MSLQKFFVTLLAVLGLAFTGLGTVASAQEEEEKPALSSGTFNAFKLRGIGPAFMSGRIADIAIVQDDPATWYVAVGSGGVWKARGVCKRGLARSQPLIPRSARM